MELLTERLRLIPLTLEQLQLMANGRAQPEQALGLDPSHLELTADDSFIHELEVAVPHYALQVVSQHLEDYLWFTHWLIVHKDQNIAIGGIGMNGRPDVDGQVMLGYYMDKKCEGRGYTTEAVARLCKWLFAQPEVGSVIADTLVDGYASQKVLKKNGFLLEGPTDEGLRWRLQGLEDKQAGKSPT